MTPAELEYLLTHYDLHQAISARIGSIEEIVVGLIDLLVEKGVIGRGEVNPARLRAIGKLDQMGAASDDRESRTGA